MRLNSLQIHAIKAGKRGPRAFISLFVTPHDTPACYFLGVRHVEHHWVSGMQMTREWRWLTTDTDKGKSCMGRISHGEEKSIQIQSERRDFFLFISNILHQSKGESPLHISNFYFTSISSCGWSEWEAMKRKKNILWWFWSEVKLH